MEAHILDNYILKKYIKTFLLAMTLAHLYYLLKSPHTIKFDYGDTQYMIETQEEDGMCAVHFDGKWYRDRDEFFQKAVLGEKKVTEVYRELYGWEVLK